MPVLAVTTKGSLMAPPSTNPPLTDEEMIDLWTGLRAQVEAEPGGLAENVTSGCCGDNLDAIITKSGGRAEMCDLASFAINVDDSIHNPAADWDHKKLSAWTHVRPPPGLSWSLLREHGWIAQGHVWTVPAKSTTTSRLRAASTTLST